MTVSSEVFAHPLNRAEINCSQPFVDGARQSLGARVILSDFFCLSFSSYSRDISAALFHSVTRLLSRIRFVLPLRSTHDTTSSTPVSLLGHPLAALSFGDNVEEFLIYTRVKVALLFQVLLPQDGAVFLINAAVTRNPQRERVSLFQRRPASSGTVHALGTSRLSDICIDFAGLWLGLSDQGTRETSTGVTQYRACRQRRWRTKPES